MDFGILRGARPDGVDVVVTGEVDIDTAAQLRTRLLAAVRDHDLVVLDLSGVTFMDSQGLSVLIRAAAAATARGAELRVEKVSDRVLRLLELAGLTALFPLAAVPADRAGADQVSPPCR